MGYAGLGYMTTPRFFAKQGREAVALVSRCPVSSTVLPVSLLCLLARERCTKLLVVSSPGQQAALLLSLTSPVPSPPGAEPELAAAGAAGQRGALAEVQRASSQATRPAGSKMGELPVRR